MDEVGGGAERPPSLKFVTHILKWWNLAVIPYLKKIQKIYESCDTLHETQIKIAFWYIISNSFNVSESITIFLINLYKILMMAAKIAIPSLLKKTIFWNKGYEITNPVNDVNNKILSCDSNFIISVFIWPKFGNSIISLKEVITTSIL